jgi:hypothetical protein
MMLLPELIDFVERVQLADFVERVQLTGRHFQLRPSGQYNSYELRLVKIVSMFCRVGSQTVARSSRLHQQE